jgi:hypothetical protein
MPPSTSGRRTPSGSPAQEPRAGEEPHRLEDHQELERGQRVDERVEGPGRQRLGRLALLAQTRAVELVRQHQRRHEERRHPPGVGSRPQEEQRVDREVERQQVAGPEAGHRAGAKGQIVGAIGRGR